MLKNICLIAILVPFAANAQQVSYISEPTSVATVNKNTDDLKKDIKNMDNATAQKIYDYLAKNKKEITDQNLLEIYYTMMSYLRIQSNIMSHEKIIKKSLSLLDELNWLYSKPQEDKFFDKVAHLHKLLKSEVFIHLDHKKMDYCLDMVEEMQKVVELGNIGNEISPEDGSDYFSSDFFLSKEKKVAQQIYSRNMGLENIAKNFSKDCEKLSSEQVKSRVIQANDFLNKLHSLTISVDGQKLPISRNTRKHLQNLTSSSITILMKAMNS